MDLQLTDVYSTLIQKTGFAPKISRITMELGRTFKRFRPTSHLLRPPSKLRSNDPEISCRRPGASRGPTGSRDKARTPGGIHWRTEQASSRHICDLRGLSVSVRELNPETSSDLRSSAEFRGHWQIEFPPCFEASSQNPYVCDSLATQQNGCAGAGDLIP